MDNIKLNRAEIQSNHNRVEFAENLIKKLPSHHDGRNTWLLNYGKSEEAQRMRANKNLKFDEETQSCEYSSLIYRQGGGIGRR